MLKVHPHEEEKKKQIIKQRGSFAQYLLQPEPCRNQSCRIVVIDDGIGCEQKEMTKNKHHFGIRNIMESMNLIGGKV